MCKLLLVQTAVIVSLFGVFPWVAAAQDEGLPAIAREVYRPHTELPPAPAARAVTERLVTEPPIVPPSAVDDTPTTVGAVAIPRGVVAPAAVVTPGVVTPGATLVTPTVGLTGPLARYTFAFYDDGNADDNWYYDYYEVPRSAVVVKPMTTDAVPGFRTTWTYDRLAEVGLFSW